MAAENRLNRLVIFLLSFIYVVCVDAMPQAPEPIPSPAVLESIISCTPQQDAKLRTDLEDAITFAEWTTQYPIDLNSLAYTHYLRPEDQIHAAGIWSVIGNRDTEVYRFSFVCEQPHNPGLCWPGGAAAAAETQSEQELGRIPYITLCPHYFSSSLATNDLSVKNYDKPGTNSWCENDNPLFNQFSIGGFVIFHEITHLDAVGVAANLPTQFIRTHGTGDFSIRGFNHAGGSEDPIFFSYIQATRLLKTIWDLAFVEPTHGKALPAPWENAHGIAAAALEWYFTQRCGFIEIKV